MRVPIVRIRTKTYHASQQYPIEVLEVRLYVKLLEKILRFINFNRNGHPVIYLESAWENHIKCNRLVYMNTLMKRSLNIKRDIVATYTLSNPEVVLLAFLFTNQNNK
jgi:hypothetical protein